MNSKTWDYHESEKIHAEIARLMAETSKLSAETSRINAELVLNYPWIVRKQKQKPLNYIVKYFGIPSPLPLVLSVRLWLSPPLLSN
ncbi:hypothetical protein [Candidatus Regiella insecticola]|uniref:hypothetical protein n=1 Tax=Candidatus Regiella insecticola TaxID=138073 RepID=UPI001C3FA346|nr:hypothetical protein [Candidatus Regiella insecticola]